jgi:hypothetical protein
MYWFPRTRFVDEKGIAGQMRHIGSELNEFKQELAAQDMQAAMIELMDLRHSVETASRILQEKYGADVNMKPLPVFHLCGIEPDDYLDELIAYYRIFADAVLGRCVSAIVLKLLWLLQAVDTEVDLMLARMPDTTRELYIELVKQKNNERGYYQAAEVDDTRAKHSQKEEED